MFLYGTLEESTLPQDIYRRLRRPRCTRGILRLRTSVEFSVVRAYGRLFPDQQVPGLQALIARTLGRLVRDASRNSLGGSRVRSKVPTSCERVAQHLVAMGLQGVE